MPASVAGAGRNPTEPRISGHAPASSAATLYAEGDDASSGAASTRLARNRIPESYAEVVEIRPARVVVIDGVNTAHKADGDYGKVRRFAADPQPRPCFDEVGPVLPLQIGGGVPVAVPLEVPGARAMTVSGAVLGVDQPVVLEAAEEYGIGGGIHEPARAAGARKAQAAAI